jgi:hypothetical protein
MKKWIPLITAIILIVYGYLARLIPVYFFWESKDIGWFLLFVLLVVYLIKRVKQRKGIKKTIVEKIVVAVILLFLFAQVLFWTILPNHDVFVAAKQFISTHKGLLSQTGDIKSFYIVPQGSLSSSSSENGKSSGIAQIKLVVKGEKKYKDIALWLVKQNNAYGWQVVEFKEL